MVTKVKQRKVTRPSRIAAVTKTKSSISNEESLENISIGLIDVSPFNYRKFYDPDALDNFASELKHHGIISPVTLRKMPSGRYELVAGERRYRAAQIAGIKQLPASIRVLTDQQVQELQLAENIQRENPHPLHESLAIAQMQQYGQSIDQIATRLGKSKAFVYSRVKLASLIEPLQLMFLAGKFSLQEAFDVATIASESQQEFFDDYCKDWKKKTFRLYNLSNTLNRFRYNLKRAPFDTKDKSLLAEMGACTKCPFNSAVLKTLFPEMAAEARCSNQACYQQKCNAHLQNSIYKAVEQQVPVALICSGSLSESVKAIVEANPIIKDLPVHERHDITIFAPPRLPEKDDFKDPWAEDEDEAEYDEDGFEQAIQEYETDAEEYSLLYQSGKASIGLLISEDKAQNIFFSLEKQQQPRSGVAVTAKQVQEAIKTGTVTSDLLEGEVERLKAREKRSKEIDRDKVQLKIHEQFLSQVGTMDNNTCMSAADTCAARMIIFQSLDYHSQRKVREMLFASKDNNEQGENEFTYQVFSELTEQQHTYLVRMALAAKSDSKQPGFVNAFALYQVAESSGLDVQSIESEQEAKLQAREVKLELKLAEMQKRLEKLKRPA